MEQFQLASAIFLKEFMRLVDLKQINSESIDDYIEQLRTQLLQIQQQQQQNGMIKDEQNNNPLFQFSDFEYPRKQKIKKKQKQTKKQKNDCSKCFYCSKCGKKFNHHSSLSRHKKNQHKNIKQDMTDEKQLQTQQQEVIINLTDLEI